MFGNVSWYRLLAGAMFALVGAIAARPAMGADVTTSLRLDYVPPTACALIAFGPAAIHEPISDAIRSLQAGAERQEALAKQLQGRLADIFGAAPEEIEQISIVFLPSAQIQVGRAFPHESGLVIRTVKTHDFKKNERFFPRAAVAKKHSEKTYYQLSQTKPAFCYLADDRTAICAREEKDMHQFIDADKTGASGAAWLKDWKTISNSDALIAFDLGAIRKGEQRGDKPAPLAAPLGMLWEKPATAFLWAKRQNGVVVEARADCANAGDAEKVKQTLEALIPHGRQGLEQARKVIGSDANIPATGKSLLQKVMDQAESLLKQPEIRIDNQRVTLKSESPGNSLVMLGAAWVLPALKNLGL